MTLMRLFIVEVSKMPRFNYEKASTVLVDAAYPNDQQAADKHGVSTRTIQRWRKRLDSDAKLAAFVARKKDMHDRGWASDLAAAKKSATQFLETAPSKIPAVTPEYIHAVAGALKILADADAVRKFLDARISQHNRAHGAKNQSVASG